jgi:hypothetical protein
MNRWFQLKYISSIVTFPRLTSIMQNAFSQRIVDEHFNFFLMFVVDLLHELELGVWKALFTHLMRILFAAGGTAIQELNFR